jgi:hypothetical protein
MKMQLLHLGPRNTSDQLSSPADWSRIAHLEERGGGLGQRMDAWRVDLGEEAREDGLARWIMRELGESPRRSLSTKTVGYPYPNSIGIS